MLVENLGTPPEIGPTDLVEAFPARERNLDAISLSNCPKLSDNPRIKMVEYTVIGRGPVSIEGQKEIGCLLRLCNLAANTENAPDPFSSP